MVNFFDRVYTKIEGHNKILSIIKIYSIQRLLIRVLSNLLIPFFYQVGRKKHRLNLQQSIGVRQIVSLTSFPSRIGRVWIVIESILRQSHKPHKVILWLSQEQFPNLDCLPKKLLGMQNRGLEIRIVEGDIKSHKKYYYTLKEFPNDNLITIDDDIIYPTTLIESLMHYSKLYPKSICCHRAKYLSYYRNNLLSYNEWPEIREETRPSFLLFQTSGGGTLYPPGSLCREVLNREVFTKYCAFADDIWLNFMSQLNETSIVKTDYYSVCLPVLNWNDKTLSEINVENLKNDVQLNSLRNYYAAILKKDPFAKVYDDNQNLLK
jgi:hypothetical protein